jgi:CRP-like cAMP-binding protein/HEAT repeat protein
MMVALLIAFWILVGLEAQWVEVAFYLFGQLYGILLISQFWTLANLIYDPREAKRLFGFIGAGASLGGILGGGLTTLLAEAIGNRNLILMSACILAACAAVVITIVRHTKAEDMTALETAGEEKGVASGEAFSMLRRSRHLQIISLIIALTSIGAGMLDQQLNMATEAFKGRSATDAMTVVLAQVQVWVSVIGFVIQVWLTSRIQRFLGIGFALLILPVGLGSSAVVILLNAALWAPVFGRVLDKSLRYTVDKTTREILFLPLPPELKQKAKPFVDVTVDRFARAAAALLLLVLIKPWGLNLNWQQISWASLIIMGLWIAMAIRAKKGYIAAFRRSIESRVMEPERMRSDVADLQTVETLIEELADPDEQRVLYAMDILESLDKRTLITPLLMKHESPRVRARSLEALAAGDPEKAERWLPSIQKLLGDRSAEVRGAAVAALGRIRGEQIADMMRPYLDDADPRVAATAATALARSRQPEDGRRAEEVLTRLSADTRDSAADARREVAAAVRQIEDPAFRPLLIPLLYDPDPSVAEEAMRSVRELGASDYLFVPTLVSLLRSRRLKSSAREVLVSYGEPIVGTLAHFMADPDEDLWVRRHLPATVARIPSQASMGALIAAVGEKDAFLRYKAVVALETLRRERPDLTFDRAPIEGLVRNESLRYFTYLGLRYNLVERNGTARDTLLARALEEKTTRSVDRIYRMLGLLYPWKDVAAVRYAVERGDNRARASALEFLDNIVSGPIRKQVMPILEDLPLAEKVNKGNVLLRTRTRDVEESLLQLINDEDPAVAALAIQLAADRKDSSLIDDIEHVQSHRDRKDWYVIDAASAALAAHRGGAPQRHDARGELLSAPEVAGRLARAPLFATVSVDELFRFATAGRQVRHESGRVLYHEGMVPETVEFLLDGRVSLTSRGGDVQVVEAPAPLGFREVLEGSAMTATARTVGTSVSLALTADEAHTLLGDNTQLIEGLMAMLAGDVGSAAPPVLRGSAVDLTRLAADGLTPVERVLVLQKVQVLGTIAADEMLALASVARETAFTAGGAPLFGESDRAAIHVIVSGTVALETAGEAPVTAQPGDLIGLYETLRDGAAGRTARPTSDGRALRIHRDDLLDVLSQRSGLLQQLFGALFRARSAAAVA